MPSSCRLKTQLGLETPLLGSLRDCWQEASVPLCGPLHRLPECPHGKEDGDDDEDRKRAGGREGGEGQSPS